MAGETERKSEFLNKDITIKRIDGSYIRGICIFENSWGIGVKIKNSDKVVFVPLDKILEILTGDEK